MRARRAGMLGWSMFALAVALGLGTLPLAIAVTRAAPGSPFPPEVVAKLPQSALGWLGLGLTPVVPWAFAALGALIVSRSPAHAIGWLFCAIGLEFVAEVFAGYYAVYALFVAPGALPGGLAAGWLQSWIWVGYVALPSALVPLRFPTGRLVSARWRPAWWLAVGATAALALVVAFYPGPLGNFLDGFGVPNPLGVAGLREVLPALVLVVLIPLLASVLLAVASLVVRLRRARGVERQQLKWFAYFALLFALLFVAQTVVENVLGISSPAVDAAYSLGNGLAFIGLPVATGLSILRYRLFDIDVLIRRTLVYGTLSAVLAGLYFGVVVGLQALMGNVNSIAASSPVIIVGTTLLVAALSNPLRHGIQVTIDRRFYRRKYDAAKTLHAFSATLRSEVELAEVSAHLLTVVNETMQPAHASLWLRPPGQQAEPLAEPAGTLSRVVRNSGDILVTRDPPPIVVEGVPQ
jgi:hypothetical protein